MLCHLRREVRQQRAVCGGLGEGVGREACMCVGGRGCGVLCGVLLCLACVVFCVGCVLCCVVCSGVLGRVWWVGVRGPGAVEKCGASGSK